MLSILIPTYNYDCYDLVIELHRQVYACHISFEIIVANDCSTINFYKLQQINQIPNCKLINLEKNLGRAKIRNYLASIAKYDTLLFLDSDSYPATDNFIKNYLQHIANNIVILGGRVYNDAANADLSLLTKYGRKNEQNEDSLTVSHKPFTSPNFLIPKNVFNKIKFNENIIGYGHEDTIFGIELNRNKIPYYRFNNPIIHLQIETNKIFIQKTNESIDNLYNIYLSRKYKELELLSPVLNLYLKLHKFKLNRFFTYLYRNWAPNIIKYCDNKNPNLILFSLYKLCYLCHIASK